MTRQSALPLKCGYGHEPGRVISRLAYYALLVCVYTQSLGVRLFPTENDTSHLLRNQLPYSVALVERQIAIYRDCHHCWLLPGFVYGLLWCGQPVPRRNPQADGSPFAIQSLATPMCKAPRETVTNVAGSSRQPLGFAARRRSTTDEQATRSKAHTNQCKRCRRRTRVGEFGFTPTLRTGLRCSICLRRRYSHVRSSYCR